MIARHRVLVVLHRRRRSEELCAMVALVWWRRTWEAEHHMIHRGPIVMVLMMLMIVHIANVHIIAHRWMQRERLGVVVREAGDLRAVAPQDVLLVLLLLEAINIKAIALITRSIVLLSFLLRLRGSLLRRILTQIQRTLPFLMLPPVFRLVLGSRCLRHSRRKLDLLLGEWLLHG